MFSLKQRDSYYEVVKGSKFNRNTFTTGKTILNVDLYGKMEIEAYVSSFRYTDDVVGYLKTNGRIRGYIGPVKTDFLYWDFDSKDLTQSYEDTSELVDRLIDSSIPEESIRIDFSGKKGFHVIVPSADIEELGARSNLGEIVKEVCLYYANDLATADDSIYNRTGIFRVVNSKHPDTGNFCIPLSVEEFRGNTLDAIFELAKTQKEIPKEFDRTPIQNKGLELAIKRAIEHVAVKGVNKPKSGVGYKSLVEGIVEGFPDGKWNSGFTSVAGLLHRHALDDFIVPFLSLMNNRGDDPMPESVLETIKASVSKYEVDEQFEEPAANDIQTMWDACEKWKKLRESYTEICTGFASLDKNLFNFDAEKMMVIAAYSRVGKTNFAIQVARNMSKFDGDDALFASLEMSSASLFYRASVIDYSYNGKFVDSREHTSFMLENKEAREEVCRNWESIKIVDKPCQSTEQISNYTALAIDKSIEMGRKTSLLIVDYVELIKGTDDVKRLAQAAREIKNIAKRYGIRVILLAQLNRTGGDEYSEPTTNSIKGSSEIFNAADIVIALWRSSETKNRIHVKDLKNREEEEGIKFDLIQNGLGYEETNYVKDCIEADGFWGN